MRNNVADKPEIYVSTDVETDGPIPGPHSMLSIGCAAYLADKTLVGTFAANLDPLPDANGHPDTMAWWAKNRDAWNASRVGCQSPQEAMRACLAWLKALPGTPVFVAYPVTFDFMFVNWYLMHFAGESPFAHSGLDMRTLAMALMNSTWQHATKRHMPESWFDALPHTHIALDDAIEQGAMFCNMLAALRARGIALPQHTE